DRGIGESDQEVFNIVRQVEITRRLERGRYVVLHVGAEEVGDARITQRFVHILVAGELTEVSDCLVAAVQQTDLDRLVSVHVSNHCRSRSTEVRPSSRKLVFDHPLVKRLCRHWPAVLYTEAIANLFDI